MFRVCSNLVRTLCSVHQKIKISQQGLEAIWMQAIMKKFTSQDVLQIQKPLMEQIVKIKLFDQKSQIEDNTQKDNKAARKQTILENSDIEIETARQKVMAMFDIATGVKLPYTLVKSQKRFSDAQNKNNQMTFYPNLITTPHLFNMMKRIVFKSQKEMIVGKSGISKSMACLLAWYLSDSITKYRYNNVEEANLLFEAKLLSAQTPKIIYANFTNDRPTNYEYFISMITSQCQQLAKQLQFDNLIQGFRKFNSIQKMEKFKQLINDINNEYKSKKIQCLVIFDQVNTLASIFESYNSLKPQKNAAEISNTERLNIEFSKDRAVTLKTIYFYLHAFDFYLYNSSTNIQAEQLNQPKSQKHYTLNLNHHSVIKISECQFGHHNLTEVMKKQLFRFIWYEIAKYIPNNNHDKFQNFIVKTCDEIAMKSSFFISFITPLAIRQAIAQIFGETAKKNPNFMLDSQQMTNLIQKIQKIGSSIVETKINKFINDQNTNEKLRIFFNGWKAISRSNNELSIVSAQQFLDPIPGQQSKTVEDLAHSIDKDMFKQFYIKQNKFFKLTLSKEEYILITKKLLRRTLQMRQTQKVTAWCKIALKLGGNFLGLSIEHILIYLIQGYVSSTLTFNQAKYQIADLTVFRHFLSKYLQDLSPNILGELFQVVQDDKFIQNYCFASPLTANQKPSTNSPSFDLLLIRSPKPNQYEIVTFDITVDKTFSNIESKAINAQERIKKLLNSGQSQQNPKTSQKYTAGQITNWDHIIVCKPTHIGKEQGKRGRPSLETLKNQPKMQIKKQFGQSCKCTIQLMSIKIMELKPSPGVDQKKLFWEIHSEFNKLIQCLK